MMIIKNTPCASQPSENCYVYDVTNNGTTYKTGTTFSNFDGSDNKYGHLSTATLSAPTVIGKYCFAAGTTVYFNSDGTVHKGTLGRSATIAGVNYGPGTILKFTESQHQGTFDGHPISAYLEHDTLIQAITFHRWTEVQFINGRVRKVIPGTGTTKIGGIEYSADPITLYENGRVESGRPLHALVFNGHKFQPREQIYFYENGKVKAGTLAYSRGKKPITVSFDEQGRAISQKERPVSGTAPSPFGSRAITLPPYSPGPTPTPPQLPYFR